MAFAVLDLTGSASDLGLVLAAKTVPMVAFLLIGGVFADRLPRRAVMLSADVVRLLSQGAMAGLLVTGHARIWELAALQAVHGVGHGVLQPGLDRPLAGAGQQRATAAGQRTARADALARLDRRPGAGRRAGRHGRAGLGARHRLAVVRGQCRVPGEAQPAGPPEAAALIVPARPSRRLARVQAAYVGVVGRAVRGARQRADGHVHGARRPDRQAVARRSVGLGADNRKPRCGLAAGGTRRIAHQAETAAVRRQRSASSPSPGRLWRSPRACRSA